MTTTLTAPKAMLFNAEQSIAASEEWGASCGPHSLAAALGFTLDDVRPLLNNFRGWMNPTQMAEALQRARQPYRLVKGLRTKELCDGISRIQWEGPWLNAGVHPAIAYHHTHWVAHFGGFVLCTGIRPDQWIPVGGWAAALAVREKPWHSTHHYYFIF